MTTISRGKAPDRPSRRGFMQQLWGSFRESIGDIVFGMEDGTVSIFGLVFGVAATAPDSLTVLLAGATGAAAAAVSMMAGTFLDVESARDQARAQLAKTRDRIGQDPAAEARSEEQHLRAMGFSEADASAIAAAIQRTPNAAVNFASAFVLQIGNTAERNPFIQSAWMFVADLFAAAVPVIPFALLPLGHARSLSIGLTTVLLLLLGLGRGLVAHTNVFRTMLETVLIAAAAAGAGLLIGQLITHGVEGA